MPTDTTTETPAAADAPVTAAKRARATAPDAALVAAVDLAREAAAEVAEDGSVGEHLGAVGEGERVVTHSFACTSKGYRGWRWAVTLARAPRSRSLTVSEVHLLPDAEAVLAPEWLPWADRLAPGDVSPGDVLPKRLDDPLLEQGFEATGDQDVDQVAQWELGLGRPRVLSLAGRDEAAQRWYDGEHGPKDPHAEQASAACATCGYFVPMAGALRQVFGVCANEWSPSDGKVVSLDHGCGAHSEVDVERRPEHVDAPVLDELGYEAVEIERDAPPADTEPVAETPAEPTTEPTAEPTT
ncbi:DUF3027 domain-containing protein [Angustibacter peucedani]